jgi:hypothetical protein
MGIFRNVRLLPSYKGNAAFGLGTANPVNEFAGLGANSQPITAVKGASGSGGITSMFDKLIPESTMGKLALGSGALALLAGGEETQDPFKERGYTGGQYRGGTLTTMDDAGNPISFDGGDEDQRRAYYDQLRKNQAKKKEVVTNYDDFGIFMAGGGEVAGPGTGTSDSVPARLSQYDPNSYQQYMDPYMNDVIQQQYQDIQRQGDIQQQGANAQAVGAGAFGGSRQGIQQAEINRNVLDQQARTGSQLRSAGTASSSVTSSTTIATSKSVWSTSRSHWSIRSSRCTTNGTSWSRFRKSCTINRTTWFNNRCSWSNYWSARNSDSRYWSAWTANGCSRY